MAQLPSDKMGDIIIRKVILRIVPFILILYMINFIDRVNMGFAGLTMNQELGINAAAFGLVSGIFFLGYILFEYPSTRMLQRWGPRLWLPRILISWGIIVMLLSLVSSAFEIGCLRFFLGVAEAGFYPGILLYLSCWLRKQDMARVISYLFSAQIVAMILGAPISTLILDHASWLGISSWRWLFILEGIPAVILGIVALRVIQNNPAEASWLSSSEQAWLTNTIQIECVNHQETPRKSIRYFFSQMWFHRIWIAYFLEVCAGYSIIFWLPQIIHSLGFSGTNFEVGLISAIPYVVALGCMLVWARHSDKTSERRYHLMIAWGCAGIGFLGDAISPDPLLSLFFLIVLTAGIYAGVPIFWTIVSERMSALDASGGLALVNSLGTIGGFIGPSVMGFFVHSSGQVDAVPALFMFGGFMFLSVFLITYNNQAHNGVLA
ncbi:MAG TPA: MFS transporter [Methanospirillum sp.]|nr:MFS transporter [Methanospirillum sp.]